MRIFFKKSTLCFSALGALALVSIEVEPWALAFCLLILFFRFGAEKKWWKGISSFWVNIFSVLCMGLVLAQFRTILGQEASSTLLVMLASLRIADFRSTRDEKFLILLGFILVALKFLYNLDLLWFPIGGVIFLGLWRSILPPDMENPWKITLKSALLSFPVVAILFFIFPRVQIPWVRGIAPQIALSGMSESIGPGDISDLTLNQQTVFRAKFTKYRPSMRELYWRGAVLEKMDGFRWNKTLEKVNEVSVGKEEINSDYFVTLEPSDLRIFPTLEHTRFISSPIMNAFKTDREIYRTKDFIVSRIQYSGTMANSWNGPTVEDPLQLTELPPKTKHWVLAQKKLQLGYTEKILSLKKLFSENGFAYTRQPGLYNDLDEFLFDRKQGFCEHYAGAFATLARALEIPARVVTGYQGGEWNDAGDFLRVTQADAHAWVEVRDPSGSWVRFDPTFWIAPLRIELGGLNYFQLSPKDLSQGVSYALNKLRNRGGWVAQILIGFQFQVDNLNYLWTKTMLNFDLGEQQKLLNKFAPRVGWWLTSIIFLFLFYFMVRKFLSFNKRNEDEAIENFLWLQYQLEKLGFSRKLFETPVDFLEKIKNQLPGNEMLVDKTISLYRFERYRERKGGPDDWGRLKRAWRKSFSDRKPRL
jgi:protein-glutamine gamma-glutamyltransferase